jgi:hypothetical protein
MDKREDFLIVDERHQQPQERHPNFRLGNDAKNAKQQTSIFHKKLRVGYASGEVLVVDDLLRR